MADQVLSVGSLVWVIETGRRGRGAQGWTNVAAIANGEATLRGLHPVLTIDLTIPLAEIVFQGDRWICDGVM